MSGFSINYHPVICSRVVYFGVWVLYFQTIPPSVTVLSVAFSRISIPVRNGWLLATHFCWKQAQSFLHFSSRPTATSCPIAQTVWVEEAWIGYPPQSTPQPYTHVNWHSDIHTVRWNRGLPCSTRQRTGSAGVPRCVPMARSASLDASGLVKYVGVGVIGRVGIIDHIGVIEHVGRCHVHRSVALMSEKVKPKLSYNQLLHFFCLQHRWNVVWLQPS